MNDGLYFFYYTYNNESENISNINSFIPTTSSQSRIPILERV